MLSVVAVVLPVFGLIFLGYYLGRIQFFSSAGIHEISKFIFYLAIPALVFRTGATQFGSQPLDLSILLLYFGCNGLLFFISLMISRHYLKINFNYSVVIASGTTYSNLVLVGLPIVQVRFGDEGLLALLTILSINALILFVIPSAMIEISGKKKGGIFDSVKEAVNSVLKNPLIIAIFCGGAWGLSGYDLPYVVDRFTALLGQAAAPCALFAVGASLSQYAIRGNILGASMISAVKLLVAPLFVWLVGRYFFELSSVWLAVAVLSSGLPVAANVFVLSERYDVGVDRASAAIFMSTFLSMISLSVMLFIMAPV